MSGMIVARTKNKVEFLACSLLFLYICLFSNAEPAAPLGGKVIGDKYIASSSELGAVGTTVTVLPADRPETQPKSFESLADGSEMRVKSVGSNDMTMGLFNEQAKGKSVDKYVGNSLTPTGADLSWLPDFSSTSASLYSKYRTLFDSRGGPIASVTKNTDTVSNGESAAMVDDEMVKGILPKNDIVGLGYHRVLTGSKSKGSIGVNDSDISDYATDAYVCRCQYPGEILSDTTPGSDSGKSKYQSSSGKSGTRTLSKSPSKGSKGSTSSDTFDGTILPSDHPACKNVIFVVLASPIMRHCGITNAPHSTRARTTRRAPLASLVSLAYWAKVVAEKEYSSTRLIFTASSANVKEKRRAKPRLAPRKAPRQAQRQAQKQAPTLVMRFPRILLPAILWTVLQL